MSRSILHCDMNNFYASVECMLDPTLKKYPVAVCGSVEERHGIVLAKNYAAKAFGVATGDAVWQAKQKCKDLVIVPPHYEEYIKYSKLARSVYSRFTDQVEPYGMDECWLDISGTEKLYGSPERVANEIKEIIKFELGLTISVGVSFNKIFAKLGSDMKKPDAITVIEKDTFRDKIWGLPAADLLGVGRATQRVLDSYCIRTIQTVNKDELTDYIGSVNDERLWKHINAALKKTFGLWIYNTDRNGDVRCLCPKCLSDYIHDPNYVVRRLDPFAKSKDNCDKCNNSGWDYIVYDKRTSVKGKGCKNA